MLGAVFLDGGLAPARKIVRACWKRILDAQALPPKDPKTALQEWVLGRGQGLPFYETIGADGPSHAPVFVVRVSAGGYSAEGCAGSKRAAESSAAATLLEKLGGSHQAEATGMTQTTRCGFAALVGAPNAGKSTLLNRMAGAKLSIVSPKAQTTRFRVLGILMRGASQILLVDTPGIFKPRRKLDRAMVAAAWTGSDDADITLLLVDARTGLTEAVQDIITRLAQAGRTTWLVLNKTDLVPASACCPLRRQLPKNCPLSMCSWSVRAPAVVWTTCWTSWLPACPKAHTCTPKMT